MNQVLSLSANVFENIKGGKSSFTIHIGENARPRLFLSKS